MSGAAGPILVTGGSGQLASALAAGPGGLPIHRVGRPQFDFDRPDSIAATFAKVTPSLVVNAAAYTAVDAAEDDPAAAYRANRDGPAALAELCRRAEIPLIQVSTDYVFDGRKGAPYVETDATGPTGVYGASKLAGEQAVLSICPRCIVLRTSWVYSPTGRNFIRTMLRLGAERDRLSVVADQVGCPTTASDLADAIVAIVQQIRRDGWQDRFGGVFHAAGTGSTSWHGLATACFAGAASHGRKVPTVAAITTADYPTKANRPADSRLDCAKLQAVFGVRLPAWRDSLTHTVDAIITAE